MKPIDCTGSAFRDLTNPYTGKPMQVKMVVRQGEEPLFFAPETYDTASFMASSREVHDKWSRVDGIAGLRTDSPPKCAYTGEVLQYSETPLGFCFVGGFNPTRLHTRDEFLKKARMRGGVSATPDPTPMSVRATPVKEAAPVPKSHGQTISQTAVDLAGEAVAKARKNRK